MKKIDIDKLIHLYTVEGYSIKPSNVTSENAESYIGMPLLIAHSDTVFHRVPTVSEIVVKKNIVSTVKKCDVGLGADDRNGIYVIAKVLESMNVPYLITPDEETGSSVGAAWIERVIDQINPSCAIVLDRRNGGDVIGSKNGYCHPDTEMQVVSVLERYGYKAETGLYSDANNCTKFGLPSVNLSVGYYHAHTANEYTDLNKLEVSIEATKLLVEVTIEGGVEWKLAPKKPITKRGHYSGWSGWDMYTKPEKHTIDSCPDCGHIIRSWDDGICPICYYVTDECVNVQWL
jgi:hypothetical protein